MIHTQTKASCLDLVRLPDNEIEDILSELDRISGPYVPTERRKYERLKYRPEKDPVIHVEHPGGTTADFRVKARNISANGLAFLHGSFIHIGTDCAVTLFTIDNEPFLLSSRVVRCRHVQGNLHEVAVDFSQSVDLSDFLPGMRHSDKEGKMPVDGPRRSSRVLFVENSIDDRELLAYWLGKLDLDFRAASDWSQACTYIGKTYFGVVIADVDLPGMTSPQLLASLRQKGYTGPILFLAADSSTALVAKCLEGGKTPVLAKPYSFDDLTALLSRCVPWNTSAEPRRTALVSERWADVRMRPLILHYLRRLENGVRGVREAMASGDVKTVLGFCRVLKSSAAGYGYSLIGKLAEELMKLLLTRVPLAELQKPLQRLIQLCEFACAFGHQAFAKSFDVQAPDENPVPVSSE